jgi:hypothetical protein
MALMGRSNSLASMCAFASACTSFPLLCRTTAGLQGVQPLRVKELYRKKEGATRLLLTAVPIVAVPEMDNLGTFFNGVSNIQVSLIR